MHLIQLKKQKEQIIHLAIMINIQIAMFVWNIQNRTIMELKNIYPTWYLKIAATPPNALKSCIPSSVSVEISSTAEFISSAFFNKIFN